jgi:pilus assembly protein CpaB
MVVIAVVLALGAVVLASRWVSQQATMASSKVAVAALDLDLGTRLTPELIKMVDWPTASLPEGAIQDAKTLDTRVIKTSLLRGEPILEAKLAPLGAKGGLSAVIGEGKRAITVRVNDVIGVAGFALPGNYVDIVVNTEDESAKTQAMSKTVSKIVLEQILVLAVAQEASRDETKPRVVNAVTLEVTPEQAEKLDLARSVGTLSLVLRNQVDNSPANTEGATKQSLLKGDDATPAPEVKTVVKRTVIYRQPTAPAAPAKESPASEQVDVIRGMEKSSQSF